MSNAHAQCLPKYTGVNDNPTAKKHLGGGLSGCPSQAFLVNLDSAC